MDEHYCDCKFKENCHMPRQYTQSVIRSRNENLTVQDCDFYGWITEKLEVHNANS